MLRSILIYGTVAGLIAGGFLSFMVVTFGSEMGGATGMAIGYVSMLVALSAIFVAIKRRRDDALGGVIRFWPAFGMGIAISAVAGVLYVACWEATQAAVGLDFAKVYAEYLVAQAKAGGATGAALAKATADAQAFRADYNNPLYRLPMSFMEIFPVGVLVSLVSAGLLRNSRFMAASRR
jgi:hypothetical protein